MKKEFAPFAGFSPELFRFLKDLSKNNRVDWFRENRERYEKYLVGPAKSFINEIAPFINRLDPAIRTEPKFNSTIMRLNNDMRFSKGDPYRAYLLLHFGRFKLDSEFFVYFDTKEVQIGLFINNSKGKDFHFKENLKRFPSEIKNVFERYKLNNKYSLYELKKEPLRMISKFDCRKHFDRFHDYEFLILQKVNSPAPARIYSDDFLVEAVKIFTSLYPLYIFCVSDSPLRMLGEFEESVGTIIG